MLTSVGSFPASKPPWGKRGVDRGSFQIRDDGPYLLRRCCPLYCLYMEQGNDVRRKHRHPNDTKRMEQRWVANVPL